MRPFPRSRGRPTLVVRCAAVVIALLMALAYATRDREGLALPPLAEDAFYALTVARHVAAGRGITYDGLLPTNGIQPLTVFLTASIYLVSPESIYQPLRAVIVVQIVFLLASAMVAGRVSRRFLPDRPDAAERITILLWLATYAVFRHSVNGLETGYYLFSLLGFLVWLSRFESAEYRAFDAVMTGGLLGAIVLVRIDGVFLVFSTVMFILWRQRRRERWGRSLGMSVLTGGVALGVSVPWWLRNLVLFGGLMPTSGHAQMMSYDLEGSIRHLVSAVAQTLCPVLPPAGLRFDALWGLTWLVLWLLGWTVVIRVARPRLVWPRSATPLAVFVAILAVYYTFFFGSAFFLERYLAPLAVITIPLLGASLATFGTSDRARPVIRSLAIVLGSLVFGAVAVEHYLTVSGSRWQSGNPLYTVQYKRLATSVPAQARIGAMQTGTLGYFRQGAVNLDGKVNSRALVARTDGRLWQYVLEEELDYVIDRSGLVDDILGPLKFNGCFVRQQSLEHFEVWKREKPVSDCPTARPARNQPG